MDIPLTEVSAFSALKPQESTALARVAVQKLQAPSSHALIALKWPTHTRSSTQDAAW